MKEYDIYLFDLDGTLITTTELIIACFRFSLKKHLALEFEDKVIRSQIGLPLKDQLQYFSQNYGSVVYANKEEEMEHYEKIEKDHMDYQLTVWKDYVKSFPGVEEGLKNLKHLGKKVGVVTSRKMRTTELFLKYLQIYDYFEVIVTPEKTQKHKPDKEPIEYALRQFGVKDFPSASAIYVGDSLYDILSAKAAEIDQALVEWPGEAQVDLNGVVPTYTVKNLFDITLCE